MWTMITLLFYKTDAQGNYILNTNRSNHLIYKVDYSRIWNYQFYQRKIWYSSRLYENTSIIMLHLTSNSTNKDNYLSLFPSFSITNLITININFHAQPSHSTTTLFILNPITSILIPTMFPGNPDLTPQFTDAFELVWIKKTKHRFHFANFQRRNNQIIDYDQIQNYQFYYVTWKI
jgi:hypothetical protein